MLPDMISMRLLDDDLYFRVERMCKRGSYVNKVNLDDAYHV